LRQGWRTVFGQIFAIDLPPPRLVVRYVLWVHVFDDADEDRCAFAA